MSRASRQRAVQSDRSIAKLLDHAADIRRAILLVLVAGVPVLFVRSLNDPINVPKLSFLIVGLSLVAGLRLAEVALGSSFSWKPLVIPAAAIATPLLVSWLVSPYKGWALWGNYPRLLGLLPLLVTMLLGVALVDTFRTRADVLAWALLGSAAVVGAYAVVQVVGLDPFEWSVKGAAAGNVASSTMGNSNFVGGLLGMVLPVGCALWYVAEPRRLLAMGLSVPVFLGWIVSKSEGGWAAGIAGLAVVGGFALSGRWGGRARTGGLVIAGIVLLGVVGSVMWTIVDRDGAPVPTTVARRGDWWEGAVQMAAEAPVLGRGPSVYALEGTRYRVIEDAREAGSDFTDDPHSVPLFFLTSAGFLGLVGLWTAWWWFLRKGARLSDGNLLAAGFFGAVCAYMVQASVSIDTVGIRTAFWTVAAGLVVASERAPEDEPRGRGRAGVQSWNGLTVACVCIAVVIALAGAWWGLGLARSDAHLQHAANLLREGKGTEAIAEFDRAGSFRQEPYYLRVYGRNLGSFALALTAQGDEVQAKEFFTQATEAFNYSSRLPHANSVLDYARFVREWAETHPEARDQMVALYERALMLDPSNLGLKEEAEAAMAEISDS